MKWNSARLFEGISWFFNLELLSKYFWVRFKTRFWARSIDFTKNTIWEAFLYETSCPFIVLRSTCLIYSQNQTVTQKLSFKRKPNLSLFEKERNRTWCESNCGYPRSTAVKYDTIVTFFLEIAFEANLSLFSVHFKHHILFWSKS